MQQQQEQQQHDTDRDDAPTWPTPAPTIHRPARPGPDLMNQVDQWDND